VAARQEEEGIMIVVPAGVKVHLALGHTDMRKGLDGLATLIQKHPKRDPFSGHLFVFRGHGMARASLRWIAAQIPVATGRPPRKLRGNGKQNFY
jgi:transposase